MAFSIKDTAEWRRISAIASGWNARCNSTLGQPSSQRVAVITFIGNQLTRLDFLQDLWRVGNIRFITRAQRERTRHPGSVHHRMQLRIPSALGFTNSLRLSATRRIQPASVNLDVGAIQISGFTPGGRSQQFPQPLPGAVATPAPVILVNRIPPGLRLVDGTPPATFMQDKQNRADDFFHWQWLTSSVTLTRVLGILCLW